MALSARALKAADNGKAAAVWGIMPNLWDPVSNPEGFVSLGVAENSLMHDELNHHLHQNFSPSNTALTYGDGMIGTKRLRISMAQFLNRHLKPFRSLKEEHIKVTNGCSTAIEHLVWSLTEPGEGILLGQPFYSTFAPDIELRFGAKLVKVPFGQADPLGADIVGMYEKALLDARKMGTRTAALLISHPHNPLGRCYTREVMISLMQLCEKYGIHFISDEIYALSVWDNTVDEGQPVAFESALSIDTADIIHASRVHVVWGMSKDFGSNGLRIGCLISQDNERLHNAMLSVGLYSTPSLLSDHVTANILTDLKWTETYIFENRKRISKKHALAANWAKKNNIPYARGTNAAFFLWLDLGAYYRLLYPEDDLEDIECDLSRSFLENKVYLASGTDYGSEKLGWFRIVFTYERSYLEEGLRRILKAVRECGLGRTHPKANEEGSLEVKNRGHVQSTELPPTKAIKSLQNGIKGELQVTSRETPSSEPIVV